MTELNINTITFAAYNHSTEEWVKWSDDETDEYGRVSDRTKRSFSIGDTTVSGDEGENVYEVEQYDPETGEFSEEPIAVPESSLESWDGPEENDGIEGGEEYKSNPALNDAEITFAASAISPKHREIATEFNEYGIRKNFDEEDNLVSVDAAYEAMEPGPPSERNGVRITSEFLQKLAEKDYSNKPPYTMDHSEKTLSQIGFVKDVWYSDAQDKLMVMARAYNTGSQTHDEIVKRLTHEPPTIEDGSLGVADGYEATVNDDGEPELIDGKIKEFSTTPFPGGYDEGGLKTQYSEEESSEVGVVIDAS